MNTYVEVKAGTPCRIIKSDGSTSLVEYPEDDLLKVTDQWVNMITCGSLIFHASSVQLIKQHR